MRTSVKSLTVALCVQSNMSSLISGRCSSIEVWETNHSCWPFPVPSRCVWIISMQAVVSMHRSDKPAKGPEVLFSWRLFPVSAWVSPQHIHIFFVCEVKQCWCPAFSSDVYTISKHITAFTVRSFNYRSLFSWVITRNVTCTPIMWSQCMLLHLPISSHTFSAFTILWSHKYTVHSLYETKCRS